MKRLRYMIRTAPSAREIARLDNSTLATFAPMEALSDGVGGLDISATRPLGEVRSGSYNYFANGDLLLAKVTPCFENGKKALANRLTNGIGFATSEVHVIRPSVCAIDRLFLYYLLSSEDFRANGMRSMTGAGGLKRISDQAILDYRVGVTDVEEQRRISKYLDAEMTRIDTLIVKKTRFIELLKEKRAAVISHAVTKGIDPDVPMKDSGVEWLGAIPAHWRMTRLGYCGRSANGINIRGDAFGSGYPFVSYGDVYKNRQLPEIPKGLVESSTSDRITYSVKSGDIFFTRTSETVDEIGLSSVCVRTIEHAVFAGFLIRVRPYEETLIPLFSKYAFQHTGLRDFFSKEMNLVTRASLSQGLLHKTPVPLPPLSEQSRIAEHLETQCEKIDRVIYKTKHSIDLLREKRSALITAAVTGKIDVREAA